MLQYNPSISGSLSVTGSLIVTNGVIGTVNGVDIQIFSSSISQVVTNIQTTTGSQDGRLTSIESFTSSVSTTNTFTSSASARLNSIETISASNIARINSLETTSASVDTLNSTQNTRLTNLEIKTGSLAITGSNTFIGTQTITGSLYISSDLIVQGSSSLQNITASAVSIGTNIINLNTANPAIRYAGLVIGDSGSIGSSGSFLYDSVQDEMIFVHRGANTTVTSSVVIMGPQTYDSIGNETYLTNNQLVKGAGNEHLADSNISDTGTLVTINSATSSFSGLVGIGTTTPSRNLHVASSGTDTTIAATKNGTDSSQIGVDSVSYIGAGGDLTIRAGGFTSAAEKVRITTGGNIGIGATNPQQILSVNNPFSSLNALYPIAISQTGNAELAGIYSTADSITNPIGAGLAFKTYHINVGLSEKMRITNGGNVGIGITNPSQKLEVVGGEIKAGRVDSSNEGGQLSFGRALDNNTSWYIDAYGSAASPQLRFVNVDNSVVAMTITGSSVGIGNGNPKTRLQVTPQSNAEVPVLGTATGVAIFTSANTNYGLQFNSTSDGSFHMQSQRFDNSATSYALVLQPAGGTVAINGNSSQAALHIGEADTRKISYIGNHSIRRTNLFKTFNQGSTTDYWARISLNNSYADSTQGVYGTITVAWHPFHASMGRFYQYRIFQSPYTANNSYMKIQTVFEEVFGWDYYSFSSDVTFYNYQSYLYIKVTGTNANYAWARSIQAELTGGSYAMDNVNLEVGVSAPASLSGIITKNGSAALSG